MIRQKLLFCVSILTLIGSFSRLPIVQATDKSMPVIHVTDLYHPHADPDDHRDLATQYALHYKEDIQLKGILIDYTRKAVLDKTEKRPIGDPDVVGVTMMNMITGSAVPIMIGTPNPMTSKEDVQPDASIAIKECLACYDKSIPQK